MQNEIIKSTVVPNKNGIIENPGWARHEYMQYVRENVKAPWYRKKEWDYYLFNTDEIAVAFTISDLGYIGLLSASVIDLKNSVEHTESELVLLPRGKKFGLGTTVQDYHAESHTKRLSLIFGGKDSVRTIKCDFTNFDGDKNLSADLTIYQPDMESMFICTPWKEKETAFYYNCKMNCLEATGTVIYGDKKIILEKGKCFGCLDWGRGVWTYDNTWYWGTGSGLLNGKSFGINLGYGFSDRSKVSENCIYYDGKVHKLSEIQFKIPTDENGNFEYMKPWKVTSDDGRFEADFKPIIDRNAKMNVAIILTDQHQVFGKLTGKAILDDSSVINFENFICALEVVRNKY
ncbi:MAG: DUF2804 domain-containing protein [Clostridia bacterium]|nr:DUF2804 domain-containing protein [Clostridia bacterium]